MVRTFRLFLLAWLTVCLPVQAAAVASMPFCGMGGQGAAAMVSSSMVSSSMASSTPTDIAGSPAADNPHAHCVQADAKAAGGGSGCDRCVLCHLAGATALPSSTLALDDSLVAVLQPAPAMSPTPFRPDLLLRPPAPSLR